MLELRPNCSGELVARPIRPGAKLADNPIQPPRLEAGRMRSGSPKAMSKYQAVCHIMAGTR